MSTSAGMTGQATRPGGYGQPTGPTGAINAPPPPPPQAAPPPSTPPQFQGGEAPDPYLNRTINGKFQILELLGQGGMGKVYKARHLGLDKIVCIKTLKPALLEDATVVGRFEREAKAASRLNHGNSIQVLDFGQDEHGTLFIVMEYVSGKDLRKTLRDEFPLGEERICHIMGQVLSALAEAHAGNVIHRDLKPENIMLEQRRGEADYVKVLDFGIAKIQDPDVPGLTRADVVCGTPLYMSPEQATGAKFDARADLYAIGVILYQLTTGTLPFDGANSMEILTKHVTELPIPPRTRRPEVAISPEMELLTLKALDKEPAGRPQSAEEFRADLLKIRDKLKRAREDAEEAAKSASTSHKQARQDAIKQKQAAQMAALTGGSSTSAAQAAVEAAALPKSKLPMFAGIGVGVVAAIAVAFVALRPSDPAKPAPPALVEAAVPTTNPAPANPAPANPVAANPAPGNPVAANPVAPNPAVNQANPTTAADPVVTAAVPTRPAPPPEPALRKGDTAKAKELADEADVLLEEEDFSSALRKYREAIDADPSFAKGYKGLFKAATGAGDLKSAKAGLSGYLRAAPDAPDAPMMKKQLSALR